MGCFAHLLLPLLPGGVQGNLGRALLREDLLRAGQDDPRQHPHQGQVRDDQVHLAQQEQGRHAAHVRLQVLWGKETVRPSKGLENI